MNPTRRNLFWGFLGLMTSLWTSLIPGRKKPSPNLRSRTGRPIPPELLSDCEYQSKKAVWKHGQNQVTQARWAKGRDNVPDNGAGGWLQILTVTPEPGEPYQQALARAEWGYGHGRMPVNSREDAIAAVANLRDRSWDAPDWIKDWCREVAQEIFEFSVNG